jgi:hypothetical protein
MCNYYVNYIGEMKSLISYPIPELSSLIEKYVFYENNNITNDIVFKPLSNGKVELFLHYNNSHLYISNCKKK